MQDINIDMNGPAVSAHVRFGKPGRVHGPEQLTSSIRVGDSNIRGECQCEAVVQKSFYKNKFGSYCTSQFDYLRELREAENRADWLKESYIAAQQHGCFQLAKEIDKLLEEVEQELKKLRSLR